MPKTLVIVESPAKAKTIGRFLGSDYRVEASIGHIRDLPEKAADIPEAYKKESWATLGVDFENGYKPLYIVPKEKAETVRKLRAAAKEAQHLLLATDEDREGESISWHILEVLGRSKTKSVRRIVFHEITQEAIQAAVKNPRDVDQDLVRAQETRRILDRLYGYSLSPLLWRKVAPRLSAGRVQSVAVRLLVERERQRKKFVPAAFVTLDAEIVAADGTFKARLIRLGGQNLADGDDFDPDTGQPKSDKVLVLNLGDGEALAQECAIARPWTVAELTTSPGRQSPPLPFMTSTLQQEASRKLRLSARETMRLAQQLYEGIDLKGERVGLITYMRTDSLTLAEKAIAETRAMVKELYGDDYLPKEAKRYKTKNSNAQEAHEAIRPTDISRKPADVKAYLSADQLRLYELIWKRTMACQMKPAELLRTRVDVDVETSKGTARFSANGQQILFPGFLKVYVEGSDDPDAVLADKETVLPRLTEGEEVEPKSVEANERTTRPPARYTEASLVRRLEEEGIGRPSTYASIISTIQDRGYCFKRKTELIPTFTAFAVTQLLETHFSNLVDLKFTKRMEDQLDEIAEGGRDWVSTLDAFFIGDAKQPGLRKQTEDKDKVQAIEYPLVPIGEDEDEDGKVLSVRIGKFGPYIETPEGKFVTVPTDFPPADFGVAEYRALVAGGAKSLSVIAEIEGGNVKGSVKKGRFGDYIEFEVPEGAEPKRVTLPPDLKPDDLTGEVLDLLYQTPRLVGKHPETGSPIEAKMGRYGAYISDGNEIRNLEGWRQALEVTLEEAVALLAAPKATRRFASATKTEPIQTFETGSGTIRVLSGRFGPYATDGTTNATLPKGTDPARISLEEAQRLLEAKREAGPSTRPKRTFKRKRAAK